MSDSPVYGIEILLKNKNPENIVKFMQLFHDDYCRKMFKLVEQLRFTNIDTEDYNNLVDWAVEYRNEIQNTNRVLEDFTKGLKENKTELTSIYKKGREIFEQIKN